MSLVAQWYLPGEPEQRADVQREIDEHIEKELPNNFAYVVEIHEADETRRAVQNRLMWHWIGEVQMYRVCEANVNHINYIHGLAKLEVLLPQMKVSTRRKTYDQGMFCQSVIDRVPEYENKVRVAFGLVRTNNITVKEFASYLTAKKAFWTDKGAELTTSMDYYWEAIHGKASKKHSQQAQSI